MDLSVVVPTLNGREELQRCLDALAERASDAETVVVDGPSSDGTTGMARTHPAVDALLAVPDRHPNAARNAGIEAAGGDAVAILDRSFAVEEGWVDAVRRGLADAPVATGPTHRSLSPGVLSERAETETVASRSVTHFDPGNVAFRRSAIEAMDGFDEAMPVGDGRDVAHRLAGAGLDVGWEPEMSVRSEYGADGGGHEAAWGPRYRADAYTLCKNYGPRAGVAYRLGKRASLDAARELGAVGRARGTPSDWLASGRAVLSGLARGSVAGLRARHRDPAPRRNPNGVSSSRDRVLKRYE